MRSMVHALSTELWGECLALPDFPERPEVIGIGMSDWDGYAIPLATKLGYTNTYFDKKPALDITNVPAEMVGKLDFILSSDVFEHVQPPVARAFDNVRRLLKPTGVFIFCVPYVVAPETVEHYPELCDWHVALEDVGYVLYNRTADGRTQRFEHPELHGGEGQTLEMRRFSEIGIRRECAEAGLSVRIHDDVCFEHGIYWELDWGITMALRPIV
jgi:SAM-dependent methyltransferase